MPPLWTPRALYISPALPPTKQRTSSLPPTELSIRRTPSSRPGARPPPELLELPHRHYRPYIPTPSRCSWLTEISSPRRCARLIQASSTWRPTRLRNGPKPAVSPSPDMCARALLERKSSAGSSRQKTRGRNPLRSQVAEPTVGRQGSLQGRSDRGLAGHLCGGGGGGLEPPSQERTAAVGSPLRCRDLRRYPTRRAMWPLQRMGPNRGALTQDARCVLCAGEHYIAPINTSTQSKGTLGARARWASVPRPSAQLPAQLDLCPKKEFVSRRKGAPTMTAGFAWLCEGPSDGDRIRSYM